MRPSQVKYHQNVAPEGALFIERPNHGFLSRAMDDWRAAYDIQNIGYEAWRNSEWLREIARDNGIGTDELAARAFNPYNRTKVEAQQRRVEASDRLGHRAVTYWLGEAVKPLPKGLPKLEQLDDLWSYMPQGQPHGFIKMERQVGSSNRLVYAAKRMANYGIYACLHDLNVLPEKQGKGLGTALAYVGLVSQPPAMRASLYTPANNEPMRAWAEKYTFEAQDEYEDDNLFDGVAVPFVHYTAFSVGEVIDRMAQINPWLTGGEKANRLERLMEEWEAEEISRNPK